MMKARKGLAGRGVLSCAIVVAVASFATFGVTAWASGPANDPQLLTLQDLRWVPARGQVIAIDGTPGQVLEIASRGHLVAGFEFQSNSTDPEGGYVYRDMDVLWRIEDADGYWISTRGFDGGDEWNGVEVPVAVTIDWITPATGASSATLRIPVGGYVPVRIGTMGRYPTLPETAARIEIAVGWRGELAVDAMGVLEGVLGTAEIELATTYPDVRIGSASPSGFPSLLDEGYPYYLCLREVATEDRTFSISAQPPGIVTVLDSEVVVPAGSPYVPVRIHGDELGEFRLVVEEDGAIVAQSDVETVVQATRIVSDEHPDGVFITSNGVVEFEPDIIDLLLGLKKCVPGREPGGTAEPTIEICYPCKGQPNPMPSCEAEGGGTTSLMTNAECDGDTGECYRSFKPATAHGYAFHNKTERPCLKTKAGFRVNLFGILDGGVTTIHKETAWCCTYKHDGDVPPKDVALLTCSAGGA